MRCLGQSASPARPGLMSGRPRQSFRSEKKFLRKDLVLDVLSRFNTCTRETSFLSQVSYSPRLLRHL